MREVECLVSCGVLEQLNVNMVSILRLVCLQLSTVAPQLLTQINIRVDIKQPQLRERDVESSCLGLPQPSRGLLYVQGEGEEEEEEKEVEGEREGEGEWEVDGEGEGEERGLCERSRNVSCGSEVNTLLTCNRRELANTHTIHTQNTHTL